MKLYHSRYLQDIDYKLKQLLWRARFKYLALFILSKHKIKYIEEVIPQEDVEVVVNDEDTTISEIE